MSGLLADWQGGLLGRLIDPQTLDQRAAAAGLFGGLSNMGAAMVAAGQPRVGAPGPGWMGALSQGLSGLTSGMTAGREAAYQQAERDDTRARQRDFTAAAGDGADDTLTPQQRAVRQAMGQNRAAYGLLGPQAGMQALAAGLNRQPQSLLNVGPGSTVLDPVTRQPVFQAPFAPRAPQIIQGPDGAVSVWDPDAYRAGTGSAPARMGGAAMPGPAPMPGGGRTAMAPLDAGPDAAAAASATRTVATGQPLSNPARPGPNSPVPNWDAGLPPPTGRINPRVGPEYAGVPGLTPLVPPRAPEQWQDIPTPAGETGQWQRNSRTGEVQRRGGTGVTVNNNPGEGAFEKGRGERLAAEEEAIRNGPRQAFNTLSRLATVEQNLERFSTGLGANARLSAGQIATQLGVPPSVLSGLGISPDQVASGEAIRSLASQMLQGMIGPGGFPAQNFSNTDRDMLMASLPSLGNSPAGNRAIIGIMRAQAERQRELGQSWADFRQRNGDGAQSFMRWQSEVMPGLIGRDVLAPLLQGFDRAQAAPSSGPQVAGPVPGSVAEPPARQAPPPLPRVGEVRRGHRFTGGNPADPNSWVPVQ